MCLWHAEAVRSLESAAAILFLQLIFPDKAPPLVKRLAWMGALSMGANAASALIPEEKKEQLSVEVRQRSRGVLEKIGQANLAPVKSTYGPAHNPPCDSVLQLVCVCL